MKDRRKPQTGLHPRARGERAALTTPSAAAAPSSPRARGTGAEPVDRVRDLRFIPARAGNGARAPRPLPNSAVHPRARGERVVTRSPGADAVGSSPRARGTGSSRWPGPCSDRFIPARAGNGHKPLSMQDQLPVHPRARGERVPAGAAPAVFGGSSPRARGTGEVDGVPVRVVSFIPARAGNGARRTNSARLKPVHPRARGERYALRAAVRDGSGSSPRARGTVAGVALAESGLRFIPARAGNGSRPQPSRRAHPVHPRARGERSCLLFPDSASHGSSPRARGTAGGRRSIGPALRFIPARAGNGLGYDVDSL